MFSTGAEDLLNQISEIRSEAEQRIKYALLDKHNREVCNYQLQCLLLT